MDAKLIARYRSERGAADYRVKYTKSLARRLSHRREMAIVRAALRRAEVAGRVLDCPCGAGRLVPTLLRVAEHVTAVDMSPHHGGASAGCPGRCSRCGARRI